MAKRGFNASITPLTEEEKKLLKLDIWDRKRSILFKKDYKNLIKNFEKFNKLK